MLNRRGCVAAPVLPLLRARAVGCPHCDVSLVLHRGARRLRCHHCGHARAGARRRAPMRLGGARAPRRRHRADRGSWSASSSRPLPVFRLDADSAAGRGGHAASSPRFERGEAGVLVGTQMVAKGHDFPDVDAERRARRRRDAALPGLPRRGADLRARRPARGRSGRGDRGGRVLVQTLAPDAPRRSRPPRATTPPASSPGSSSAAASSAIRRSRAWSAIELGRTRTSGRWPPRRSGRGGDRGRRSRGRRGPARPGAPLPAARPPPPPAPGQERRAPSATVAAVRDAVEAAAVERELRGVSLAVDVDPQ